jgi:hypothetical protein
LAFECRCDDHAATAAHGENVQVAMPAADGMAQKYFKQQGSGEQQSWDLAFENGYTDGFKKTHHQ